MRIAFSNGADPVILRARRKQLVKKISIVIAEDNPVVRQGIRGLLESQADFRVIGESDNGFEALHLVEELVPNILVTDIEMPGMSGIEVLRFMQRLQPRSRAVVLSMHDNEAYVLGAQRNGALAYLTKSSASQHLIPAVRSAIEGKVYLYPQFADASILGTPAKSKTSSRESLGQFDEREEKVLWMMRDGFPSDLICARRGLKPDEMQTLVTAMIAKAGVGTEDQLVRLAQMTVV